MQSRTASSLRMFGEIVSQALTGAFRECGTIALEAAIAVGDAESPSAEQPLEWFYLDLRGSLQGRVCLAIRRSDIPALGLRTVPDMQTDGTAALLPLLHAMAAQLPKLGGGQYGITSLSVEPAAEPASPNAEVLHLTVSSGAEIRVSLLLYLEQPLVGALLHPDGVLFPRASPAGENLELVLDVELNATLRFGQRQLTLRDILNLTSGSVVELDRQVDEPVELVLDGRVIARGEAVIIDGNYGMRITDILYPVHAIAASKTR